MEYIAVTLRDDFIVEKLITVHYFEYTNDYSFSGERHDFWELVFMDKGEAIVAADDKMLELKAGEVIFHKPNEWHTIMSNGIHAPNIAIVSFVCNSPAMSYFNGRITKVTIFQRWLLARLIEEARKVFATPLNDPYVMQMIKRKETPIGSEQLIKLYLTEFLLSFVVSTQKNNPEIKLERHDDFNSIVNYMEENLSKKLTIRSISQHFNISSSTLKHIFAANKCNGVIAYFIEMKIEYAKRYIREGKYNITQISQMLGYDKVNYFCSQFKQHVKMTPSEYAASIKSLQDGNNV